MTSPLKADTARKPEQEMAAKIMSHEEKRTVQGWLRLHAALCAAEADIIQRKGPDWNKAAIA